MSARTDDAIAKIESNLGIMEKIRAQAQDEFAGLRAGQEQGARNFQSEVVAAREETERPSALICHTLIGKGVSFMEDQPGWHGVAPGDDDARKALTELGIEAAELEAMMA